MTCDSCQITAVVSAAGTCQIPSPSGWTKVVSEVIRCSGSAGTAYTLPPFDSPTIALKGANRLSFITSTRKALSPFLSGSLARY